MTARATPTKMKPHGRSRESTPLMIVAISVACGAGRRSEPIGPHAELCRPISVKPMTATETSTPMMRPICW